jgi:hypothetical protein
MNLGNSKYSTQIQSYLKDCYFDFGATPSNGLPFIIDEAKLAKMLTKIVVSTATIVTTTLSLKQYAREISLNYKRNKL